MKMKGPRYTSRGRACVSWQPDTGSWTQVGSRVSNGSWQPGWKSICLTSLMNVWPLNRLQKRQRRNHKNLHMHKYQLLTAFGLSYLTCTPDHKQDLVTFLLQQTSLHSLLETLFHIEHKARLISLTLAYRNQIVSHTVIKYMRSRLLGNVLYATLSTFEWKVWPHMRAVYAL